MEVDKDILEVLDLINRAGHQAYIVGGAVRNHLLGLKINDYDIGTSARPEEIEEIFRSYRTIDIGKKFGSILLLYKEEKLEITSFRSEGVYLDGRRPDQVEFTRSLRLDLQRRDFTINAMAWHPKEGLIDYFKGEEDLKKGLIRTVNDPRKRFSEDYLRILRAIRFTSQLGFRIEDASYQAMEEFKEGLGLISRERIRDEFFKSLLGAYPATSLVHMKNLGLLKYISQDLENMVGFNQETIYHDLDLFDHSLAVVKNTPRDLILRLAGLFHDIGKPRTKTLDKLGQAHYYGHQQEGQLMARKILRGLNTEKKIINSVEQLIYYHMVQLEEFKDKTLKRYLGQLGELDLYRLIQLQMADKAALSGLEDRTAGLLDIKARLDLLLEQETVYSEKQLAINGQDVIELGYKKGPIIGEILSYALEQVMDKEELNNKEILIKLIEENFLDRREV